MIHVCSVNSPSPYAYMMLLVIFQWSGLYSLQIKQLYTNVNWITGEENWDVKWVLTPIETICVVQDILQSNGSYFRVLDPQCF